MLEKMKISRNKENITIHQKWILEKVLFRLFSELIEHIWINLDETVIMKYINNNWIQ